MNKYRSSKEDITRRIICCLTKYSDSSAVKFTACLLLQLIDNWSIIHLLCCLLWALIDLIADLHALEGLPEEELFKALLELIAGAVEFEELAPRRVMQKARKRIKQIYKEKQLINVFAFNYIYANKDCR